MITPFRPILKGPLLVGSVLVDSLCFGSLHFGSQVECGFVFSSYSGSDFVLRGLRIVERLSEEDGPNVQTVQ